MLTKTPLDEDPALCRLLASAVRNCCSVDVSLDVLLLDAPNADSKFWKSLSSVLVLDEVLVVSLVVEVLAVAFVDVLFELDDNDCARLSIAAARPLP